MKTFGALFQVSFVQYSDDANAEFNLNTYDDKAQALGALQNIRYKGGNTKIGTFCYMLIPIIRFLKQ